MRLFILSFLLFMGLFVNAQETIKKPVDLKFDSTLKNIGTVIKGDIKTFKYHFVNSGTDDIEIDEVTGCSCTTTQWTKGIIKPGESGVIDVTFHSADKKESGMVNVDVYLKNIDPEWDAGYSFELLYEFELKQ